MAAHCLLNSVVLHVVRCMKYLEHITFCELAVLWSVVIFNDVIGDVVCFNSGHCCGKVVLVMGKQQIGIQILGNLHNLILLKKCQVKTWNYLCWAHFMDGPWIMIKSVQCVQQCTRLD